MTSEIKKNYKLLKMLDENRATLTELSDILGIAYNTVLTKVSGRTEWTASEIKKIKEHFNLAAEMVDYIFLQ